MLLAADQRNRAEQESVKRDEPNGGSAGEESNLCFVLRQAEERDEHAYGNEKGTAEKSQRCHWSEIGHSVHD